MIASALFELSTLVPESEGAAYFERADADEPVVGCLPGREEGYQRGFILKHSVGHLPADSEIDTPLNYADYYYLEAIQRYLSLRV